MTDSKELVELAKRGGLEMTQGSSVGTDSVRRVSVLKEHGLKEELEARPANPRPKDRTDYSGARAAAARATKARASAAIKDPATRLRADAAPIAAAAGASRGASTLVTPQPSSLDSIAALP